MFQINTNFIPTSANTFIVGGSVRDLIIGASPKDMDIVTLDEPGQLARDIAGNIRGKIIEMGKPGMKIFRIIAGKQTIDIARANGKSIEADLGKRDFTINAMAISIDAQKAKGEIIDPHNGMADLRNKKIRMISPANLRTDPVRLLRAYRIGSILNFTICRETSRAIRLAAPLIKNPPGERIRDELIKLFNSPRSYHYILMMNETGLLTEIFPELAPLKSCSQNAFHEYDALEHTLNAYGILEALLQSRDSLSSETATLKKWLPAEKHYAILKYTILLHDIGKPRTRSIDAKGHIHFYCHEKVSADMAVKVNQRLRFSNQEQRYMDFIIRNHLRALPLFTAYNQNRLSQKAISRFFLKCGQMTKDILIHTAADFYGKGSDKSTRSFNKFLKYMMNRYTDSFLPKQSIRPLITGNDLICEFGLKPSALFSKILQYVEEERYSDNITTRKEALILVENFLNPA